MVSPSGGKTGGYWQSKACHSGGIPVTAPLPRHRRTTWPDPCELRPGGIRDTGARLALSCHAAACQRHPRGKCLAAWGRGHPVCAWLGVAVAPLTRCTQPQCILITSPGLPHVLPVASDGRRPREGNPRGCRPQHPRLCKPSLHPACFGDPRLRSSACWCRTAPAAPTRLFETAMAAKTHLRKPYGPVLIRRRQID